MRVIFHEITCTILLFEGFLVTQGLLLVLYIWEPRSDSVYSILGFMSLWGAVDAVWQSQVQGEDRQIYLSLAILFQYHPHLFPSLI